MHDLVVVSDLHLGRGLNADTGRYYRLEAFFYDDDFLSFCRWLCAEAERRKNGFKLVLNGDTFDLLRIDRSEPESGLSARERRFGPVMVPSRAAETVGEILAGHRGFVAGLAEVLSAGNQVVILPGNHDMELQWEPVQTVIRDAVLAAITEREDEARAETASRGLTFERWFHYEPGRIWIEHGCQYDKDNSFEYSLRGGLAELPDAVVEAERDVPMGTFFQRYLYNKFGNLTFIVPSPRANLRYFRWLLLNRPRLLAKVATSHFPFFLQVIRRISKAGGDTAELARMHDRDLSELAESSGLGDKLLTIDKLKAIHGSAAQVAQGIIMQVLKIITMALLLALLVAGSWFAGFYGINQIDAGLGLKAILFVLLNFVFLTTIFGLSFYLLLRPPLPSPSRPARRAARRIAAEVDVPIVTFGHSHDEGVFRLRRRDDAPGWYYNTGTWIAVFTHDELLPRERVQYTFLRVLGADAHLLHYSPGRNDAVPVVLLEYERGGEPERPTEAPPA